MLPLFRRRVSKKSRYDSTLPQKSQQKIQDTLPQKSQHKIKIRYHSSAEESAKIKIRFHSSAEGSVKSQDTLPLFRRRVSKKSRYASTLPQKSQSFKQGVDAYSPQKYIFYGVDANSPTSNLHGVDAIPPKLSNHVI